MTRCLDRRRFLYTTALTGIAAALWIRPASALRLEENEPTERLYLAACEARTAHDQLIQELVAELEGQEGREKAAEMVRAMACPVCGCKLGAVAGPLEGTP